MAKSINNPNYPIHINVDGALDKLIQELSPSKIFVIVDTITEQLCLFRVLEILPDTATIIHIETGEIYKNLDTASFIWKSLMENGADRQSLVINLGGGVIGDMGGFCAATYMRGIKFVQVPTTLLSQVDSSVGSKLGIDFENVKNIIGVFQEPLAVVISTSFLSTLPYKQLLSGYAEVLKHSLIADADMWNSLSKMEDITSLDFEDIVYRNINIKNNIVSQDPKEAGLRKILNFGHTIGHSIESILLGSEEELLHGEAIAIGMVCESFLSHTKGFISLEEAKEIKEVFIKLYGNKKKSLPSIEKLIQVMKLDKKNHKGIIMFSLLEKIGQGNYNIEVSVDEIAEALEWYRG